MSIDLETTGLNPKQDKIIEIGALKVVDGIEAGSFSCFVNPGRRLEPHITGLTGIQNQDLTQAPGIEELLPGLFAFLEDYPLLGHSVLFDYSFLKKAAVNQRMTFEKEAIDTLKLARKYLAQLEHRNLDSLCGYYGIPHHAHRALEDARATSLLYQRLLREFYREEEPLFMPRALHFQAKRDTPATKAQRERLYRLFSLHKIEPDIEIEGLTRSEASRLTDKFLAKYGR
ncbi:MAG: 3'-5' exonuclease [Roseburia sp.]|nr:3'-5' exonuclease [Roseburia sp.]